MVRGAMLYCQMEPCCIVRWSHVVLSDGAILYGQGVDSVVNKQQKQQCPMPTVIDGRIRRGDRGAGAGRGGSAIEAPP